MEPTITAAGRFTSVFFARNPRCKIGTINASEGESMACTNDVSVRDVKAEPVFSTGFVNASMSTSVNDEISGFRTTCATSTKAAFADSRTFLCVLWNASTKLGTIAGRHVDSCLGAQ